MNKQNSNNRVVYLDVLRAFAVIMMVQGHTVHTFLMEEYRTMDYLFYGIWHTMRGFTAPIFMFTAGCVFAYLFKRKSLPFFENPRVKKGLVRFLTLLCIGYLLRFPTLRIFDFFNVSRQRMLIFVSVDALHLIAFGILFIIAIEFIGEKIKIKDSYLFILATLLFFILAVPFRSINFLEILPLPVAAYFNYDTGSNFPLFPWAGYVLSGAYLGYYLAKNPKIYLQKIFALRLILIGILLIIGSYLLKLALEFFIVVDEDIWNAYPMLPLFRVGVVLILNGLISFICRSVNKLPKIINLIGRHTLSIYVVHLIILYGCVFTPGFYYKHSKILNVGETIGAVLVMFSLMLLMVYLIDIIKRTSKNKIKFDIIKNKIKAIVN
ncbi:MAG: heparan-alpha-glucosaminide N-acetyltransferase domain-containing protein [Ignavibacteria bacterium]|jgi:uncharacterized membrane protein